jgi:hypothetical protein
MPDPVALTLRNGGFHIEGYPDAVKVIRIEEPAARALSDLALHQDDLALSLEFLEVINRVPPGEEVMREGLWRAAIGASSNASGGVPRDPDWTRSGSGAPTPRASRRMPI